MPPFFSQASECFEVLVDCFMSSQCFSHLPVSVMMMFTWSDSIMITIMVNSICNVLFPSIETAIQAKLGNELMCKFTMREGAMNPNNSPSHDANSHLISQSCMVYFVRVVIWIKRVWFCFPEVSAINSNETSMIDLCLHLPVTPINLHKRMSGL